MRRITGTILLSLCFPFLARAASKDMLELQRDVANLQEQVAALQKSLNDQAVAIRTLSQQILDGVNSMNTRMAVLQKNLDDSLGNARRDLAAPVADLGAKVDQMASGFQAMSDSFNRLNNQIGGLQQQVLDIGNTLKNSPAQGAAATASPAPSAEGLYYNAIRDKSSGKYDLALQEFGDYLKNYPSTDLASEAQFDIGDIYYGQQKWEDALKNFDLVLQNYGQSPRAPDALYMKGMTLLKAGRPVEAGQALKEVVRRYPGTDLAEQAKSKLKNLGV